MQHNPNKHYKLDKLGMEDMQDKEEKPHVHHKPSFYVTATAITVLTCVISTAAFAIHGVLSAGIKILSLERKDISRFMEVKGLDDGS
jgi:hypothetical protein